MLAGEHRFLEQADRLIAAIAPQAVENLYMHMALLNAVDLRMRAAEIVVTGEGAAAQALLAAARARPPLDRIVLSRRFGGGAAAATPGAGEDRRRGRARSLCLRRRNLLAAGHGSGRPHWRHRFDATYLTPSVIP